MSGTRRTRWRKAVVAACAVVALAWFVRQRSGPAPRGATPARGQAQARPVPVVVTTVSRRDVPVYLEGLGNVIAYKTVMVKTQVDGVLEQVLFREGQAVRRGDVLAQVDPRPFQIQLKQGEGALARDRAQLVGARRNLERYEALAAEKLIPQQQADDQAALVGQLEGAVRVDEAAIASARLNLDYARIRSPIDGVTGIRNVDPGNVVHPGDQNGIVVVTQLDPIAVLFTLPQDQLTPVFTELARAPLPVEAFSRDGTTLLGKGQLALVDNQINQATSTIRLKAVFPNPKRLLWPNQFVNARLHLTTRKGALVIPSIAVQRGPNRTFVYVVGQDGTAAARPVELAGAQGDLSMVSSGVEEGERIVVEGQNQLRPGSRVALREPHGAAAANGGPAPGAGGPGGAPPGGGGGGAR